MRPILDVEGKFTFTIAVQCEVDESSYITMPRKLRKLEDLLDMFPKSVPFRQVRLRDRAVPPLPISIPTYDSDSERAAVRRYVFFLTRLKWLMDPHTAVSRLLDDQKLRNLVHDIVHSEALGSAATMHAFEEAVAPNSPPHTRKKGVRLLADMLLPRLLHRAEGVRFVLEVRRVEREEKTSASKLVFEPLLPDNTERPDYRLADGFFQCFVDMAREAPVSCIASDMTIPGLPLAFANSRFLHLAGLASESDVIGKNCRFMQGEVSHTSHQYLVEEISAAIRERRGVLVKMFNYARGKVFQNFIALHPVFATENGEYLFQIGMQVNMNDKDEIVEAKLAELEQFMAHLPCTVDASSAVDRARLPSAAAEEPEVERAPTDSEPLPPIIEQGTPSCDAGNGRGVMWEDAPHIGANSDVRFAVERECLAAIIGFTRIKWLETPEETTSRLLRQQGYCHDAFADFAASRSRVARALVQCWELIEEILSSPTVLEQKRLALKHHAAWLENPLFLFSQLEIPVGSLSKLDFNWDPILKQLPHTQDRCAKILSVNVLPAFLDAEAGKNLIFMLLGHPTDQVSGDEPQPHLIDSAYYHDANVDDSDDDKSTGAPGKLLAVSEIDPDLYTAAHYPGSGMPLMSMNVQCADKAAFWLEMAVNLVGDDDASSLREKERLNSLNGAIVNADQIDKLFSPQTSSWMSSLVSGFGQSIVEEVRSVLDVEPKNSPRSAVIADGRILLLIQPFFANNRSSDESCRIIFSVVTSADEKHSTSFYAVSRFLQHAPRTYTGRTPADSSAVTASLHELSNFMVVHTNNSRTNDDEKKADDTENGKSSYSRLSLPSSLCSPKRDRPSTAPASRSIVSHMTTTLNFIEGVEAPSDISSFVTRPTDSINGHMSYAARSLMLKINRKLDSYVEQRRQQHEEALNSMGEIEDRRSQAFDARSTSQNLKNLIQERTALWHDGLMEKALELDETIAQLQAEHRKERMDRLARVLAVANSKLEQQHQLRLRTLQAKHKQERMTLDKQIQEGIERLREQHQKQADGYINEVMIKTGATTDINDEEAIGTKPYLNRQQRYSIRTTTRPPEMVRTLRVWKQTTHAVTRCTNSRWPSIFVERSDMLKQKMPSERRETLT